MKVFYEEYLPSAQLKSYVENYWFQVFNGEKTEESPLLNCLPIGSVQIVVHINQQDCWVNFEGSWHQLPHSLIVGLYKGSNCWKTKGYSICFGINLKPEYLTKILKIPASELVCDYTDIQNLHDQKLKETIDKMYGNENPLILIKIFEDYLLNFQNELKINHEYLHEGCKIIRETKGDLSIESLSNVLQVSERQLQRSFKESIGVSPKMFSRLIRFKNTYQQVKRLPSDSMYLKTISYDNGYSDQAHFIREFREFAGMNPSLALDYHK